MLKFKLNSLLITDGSDGWQHGKGQHGQHGHHGGGHHSHHGHHGQHHYRQRRHEWSPSQAIHEKQSNVKSQITFGHETMAASEWVFLTKNASTVKAHIGSTALLPCEVKKDSQFGMVSEKNYLASKGKSLLESWGTTFLPD